MIKLRALGNAEIETSVTTLTPSQEIVFAAALYLILQRGQRVSRTRLASLLWPRVPEKVAAHRLRQTILQLKKLGITFQADRCYLQLLEDDVRSDVDLLLREDAIVTSDSPSWEFMPGYSPRCSEYLRDWVDAKREEIHRSITRVLIRDLEQARHKGDWIGVEKLSSRCLALDPFNEVAVLAQAEATAMRGGKIRAIEILDRYIEDVGGARAELRLPASILRRRVSERFPDKAPLQNGDPPFVGREVEMELLTARLEAAKGGKGAGVLLTGEAGIGKSRLSEELARFAALQGAQLQRATCRRTDLDRPLSLFVDVVPQLREMPGALGCSPETFTLLKRLTDFEFRQRDRIWSADSETLFGDLQNALFDLIDSVATERWLLVVIDDVQWLDDVSAKILGRMIEWAPTKRLLFVLNSRIANSPVCRFADTKSLCTISLGPLPPVASRAVLHSIASRPGDQLESDFFEWCVKVAEGNPFFLQELGHHWVETGHKYEAPPSVTKVLDQRLSRLSKEGLHVLQCCSVLSEHATLTRVEAVLQYPTHQILSAVEELSRAAMLGLHREGLDQEDRIQPRHDLLSSAALHGLAEISLALIHRRAAEVLEREIAQAMMPTTLLWACANHRHCAGDRNRALMLSTSCAEHLLNVGLAGDASAAFKKSLEYCTTDEQRLDVLPRLAFASQLNSDWTTTKDVLRLCIRLAGKTGPEGNSHNQYELQLFEARHQSGFDFSLLLEDMMPCVQSADASPSHRVYAAVIALKIATDIGPADTLDRIYECVAPFLEESGIAESSRLEVEIIYRTTRGCEVIPMEFLRHYVEISRAHGGELAYSNALLTAAAACRLSARYEEGLAFVGQALDHAVFHKRRARLPRILVAETRLHVSARAYDRAESTLQRMMDCPISPEDTFAWTELQFFKARLAVEKNDFAAATTALDAIRDPQPAYSPRRKARLLALRLYIGLMGNADQDKIRMLVDDLATEHAKVRSLDSQDFEAHALYLGLCSLGERRKAATLLTDYVRVHRRSRWPVPQGLESALRRSAGVFHADPGRSSIGVRDDSNCQITNEMAQLS